MLLSYSKDFRDRTHLACESLLTLVREFYTYQINSIERKMAGR